MWWTCTIVLTNNFYVMKNEINWEHSTQFPNCLNCPNDLTFDTREKQSHVRTVCLETWRMVCKWERNSQLILIAELPSISMFIHCSAVAVSLFKDSGLLAQHAPSRLRSQPWVAGSCWSHWITSAHAAGSLQITLRSANICAWTRRNIRNRETGRSVRSSRASGKAALCKVPLIDLWLYNWMLNWMHNWSELVLPSFSSNQHRCTNMTNTGIPVRNFPVPVFLTFP